ncbi:hypothetical protein CYMTET_14701 [Cymbomonas tetramitiformis]|uniref:Uncharacterized protein n=1 Tax=Cymbomonas tetramitiformis TaxID=36881 RepID=A0AAE0L9N2_9CHLO|nr:hypothetical protein CYMTET_14701 [Cymbomonas tetramitiformis]
MRAYNIAHRFENHKMGITTKEWLKLPEAKQKQPQQQQRQQVEASAEVKEKLAAELTGLQTGAPPKGGKGAEAQAQSEDGDDETEYNSNFNQQAEYEENERDCLAEQPTEVNEHELEDVHATVVQGVEEEAESAEHQMDEELPLDEMPDGVVDSVTARYWAAEELLDD